MITVLVLMDDYALYLLDGSLSVIPFDRASIYPSGSCVKRHLVGMVTSLAFTHTKQSASRVQPRGGGPMNRIYMEQVVTPTGSLG